MAQVTPAARSADERRIERTTRFFLVGALVVTGARSDWPAVHKGETPLAACVVLILPGIAQFRRRFRVGYTAWIAGTLLLIMACVNFIWSPEYDLSLLAGISAVIVIGAGIFSRKT